MATICLVSGVYCIHGFFFKDNIRTVYVSGVEWSSEDNVKELYLKTRKFYYDAEPTWTAKDLGVSTDFPLINGKSGLIVDINTDKTLYSKNPTEKLKIASLTKIMTAILVLEHKNLTDKVYIDAEAASIGENSMGLKEGEIYTVEELLYGLILNSGNDSAYALAKNSAGSVENFVEWMNLKANELGMKDTQFYDPSGLNDNTYSTALDLTKLTRYGLKIQTFREIIKTMEKEINGDTHNYQMLTNQTNLLSTYPGVMGVKTGYTEEAGLCLVTYAMNNSEEVIGVVLNSTDRRGDMILMLDEGFSRLGIHVEHNLLDSEL